MQFLVKLFESLHHFFPGKDKHGKSINCTAFCNLALFVCFFFVIFCCFTKSKIRYYHCHLLLFFGRITVHFFLFFQFYKHKFPRFCSSSCIPFLISAFLIFILYNIKLYFSLCIFLNSFFIAF